MSAHGTVEPLKQTFSRQIENDTGVKAAMCYQCGKCAAGCPLAEDMDIAPNQILRMLQMDEFPGIPERILGSLSIWLCLTCETCHARCPKDVELPVVMDWLRAESVRRDLVHHSARNILAFHRSFLDMIRAHGRSFELGLLIKYKLRSGKYFQDVALAPATFSRGKMGITPHRIKGRDAIIRMFEKAEKEAQK